MNNQPNKENLRKWIKALRSGDYEQIKGTLKVSKDFFHSDNLPNRKDGYCCLGVGCEIYKQESGDGYWNINDQFVLPMQMPEQNIMPNSVANWFGLSDENPLIGDHHLTEWNDKENASFEEIANLIEKEYEL